MSKGQRDKANHEQPHQTVEIDDLPVEESMQNNEQRKTQDSLPRKADDSFRPRFTP
jgi:hypothetical protein